MSLAAADDTELLEELEELDLTEFGIPQVEEPTLESILNDKDSSEEYSPLTENNVNLLLDSTGSAKLQNGYHVKQEIASLNALKSLETVSITSSNSYGSNFTKRKTEDVNFHGPVLSFYQMQNLSDHIKSSADRINSGRPTAMAVSSMFAVSTSHGLALAFDAEQNLSKILGSVSVGNKYGSVTALAFNTDCDRLLVGYAKGQILMYDVKSGSLLRTITDAHPPGFAILHVKFTDDPTLAVCNDSGGSVFELNFRRVMGVRSCESRCLFSGSRGEVCIIEALHISKNIANHPLRDRHLLVMGTLTKILVVCLRPQVKVVFSHQLKRNPTSLPLVSWQLSVFHSEGARYIDPLLMFGRGDVIYFFQVKSENWESIVFSHIQTMNLTYNMINFAWLQWFNSQTILTLDFSERLHVIDVNTQSELETISLENVSLIYNSATFKSIATGGNVSKALAMVGEHACYHSMVEFNGSILFLGNQGIYAARIQSWKDRIQATLAWPNGHQRALQIALNYYNGKAKAVVGLPSETSKREVMVAEKILDLLVEYVDLSMTKLCPENGKLEILITYFRDVVPVCVEYCLHINRIDVLCGRIYERFRADCIAHSVFLECLEPYILDDKLKTISPVVMQDFVKHYESKNMLSSVEACLLHLDVATIDLHQVLNLCWLHNLFDGIISVNNRLMHDYSGPLMELLKVLSMAMDSGDRLGDEMTRLGQKLLVYLSCCLAGIAYPNGILDEEMQHFVKSQIYECMIEHQVRNFSEEYPVFTILLRFSTQEFLHVLSLTFAEPEFEGLKGRDKVQYVINILLQTMVEASGFTPDQVGTLFIFLARQVASHHKTEPIDINKVLIEQIVEYLTTPDSSREETSKYEEKQQALVELITSDVIGGTDQNSRLVTLVERTSFFNALRLLYGRQHRYEMIFETYLRDSSQKMQAFRFIKEKLQDDSITISKKEILRMKILENIKKLIAIDSSETATLIQNVLPDSLDSIVINLKDQPQVLYSFLKELFNSSFTYFGELDLARSNDHFASEFVNAEEPITNLLPPEITRKYFSLMCQFERDQVLPFLKSVESNRPANVLEIVKRYHVEEATSYLLEESGDYAGAFTILHRVAKDNLHRFIERCERQFEHKAATSIDLEQMKLESQTIFKSVNDLCQRISSKLTSEQMEKIWFPLLHTIIAERKKLAVQTSDNCLPDNQLTHSLEQILVDLGQFILASMISHMSLPALLQNIIQDPTYYNGNFGGIREILMGMLETYQYEKTLLDTAISLLSRIRHQSLTSLRSSVSQGMAPRSQLCAACKETILGFGNSDDSKNAVVVFGSGTAYHESCLKFNPSMLVPNTDQANSAQSLNHGLGDQAVDQVQFSPASTTTVKKHVVKERRNYFDRKRIISNGSKIFPSAKGSKERSAAQSQRVFRKEGSLFAIPVSHNSASILQGMNHENNGYVPKTVLKNDKTGELQPQDFKLSLGASSRLF